MSNRSSPSPGNEFLFSLGGLLKRFKLTTENFKDQEILTLANLDNGYRRKFIVKKVDERSLFGRRGSKGSRGSRSSQKSQKSQKDTKSDKGSRSGSLRKEKKSKPEDKKDGRRKLSTSSIYSFKSACSLKSFGRQKSLGSQTSLNSQKSITSEKSLNKKNSFGSGKFKLGCGSSSESDDEVFQAFSNMTANDKEEKEDPGFINPALVKEDFEDEGVGGLEKDDEGVEVLDLDKEEKEDRDEKDEINSKRSDGDGSSETESLNSLDSNMSGPRFNITSSPRPTRRGGPKRHQQPSPVMLRRDCQSNRSSVSSQARKGILKKTHSSTTLNLEMTNISRPQTPTENGHTSKSTDSFEDTYCNGDGSRFVRAGGDNVALNHQRSFNRVKFILDSGKPDKIIGDYGDYDDIKIEKIERERNDRIDRGKAADATSTNGLSRSGKKCLIFTAGLLVLTMAVILGSFFGSRKSASPPKDQPKGDASYNKFIVGALEGKFRIINETFDAHLYNSDSERFRKLSKQLEDIMVKAIFIEESANQANSSIKLRIVKYEEGSVISIFRIKWEEKSTLKLVEIRKRILKHLDKYGAFGEYKIDKSSFTISELRDLCYGNSQSCSHICVLSDETLRFGCTCPDSLVLVNKTSCLSPKLASTTAKNLVLIPDIINKVLKISNANLLTVNQESVSNSKGPDHPTGAEETHTSVETSANATSPAKNGTVTEEGIHINATAGTSATAETTSTHPEVKPIDIHEDQAGHTIEANRTSNATNANGTTSIQQPTEANEKSVVDVDIISETNSTDEIKGTIEKPILSSEIPLEEELQENLPTDGSLELVTEKLPEPSKHENLTAIDTQFPEAEENSQEITEKSTEPEENLETVEHSSVNEKLNEKQDSSITEKTPGEEDHLSNEENIEDVTDGSLIITDEKSLEHDKLENPEQLKEANKEINGTKELHVDVKEPDEKAKDSNGTKEQTTESEKNPVVSPEQTIKSEKEPTETEEHTTKTNETLTSTKEETADNLKDLSINESESVTNSTQSEKATLSEEEAITNIIDKLSVSESQPSTIEDHQDPPSELQVVTAEEMHNGSSDATLTTVETSTMQAPPILDELQLTMKENVSSHKENAPLPDQSNVPENHADGSEETANATKPDKPSSNDKIEKVTEVYENLHNTLNETSRDKQSNDAKIVLMPIETHTEKELNLKMQEKVIDIGKGAGGSTINDTMLLQTHDSEEGVVNSKEQINASSILTPTAAMNTIDEAVLKPNEIPTDENHLEALPVSTMAYVTHSQEAEIKHSQLHLSNNATSEEKEENKALLDILNEQHKNDTLPTQIGDSNSSAILQHLDDNLVTATLMPDMFLTLDPNINEVLQGKIRDKNNSLDEDAQESKISPSEERISLTSTASIKNINKIDKKPTTVSDYVLSTSKSSTYNGTTILTQAQIDEASSSANNSILDSKEKTTSQDDQSYTTEKHQDEHLHSTDKSSNNGSMENNFHIPLPILIKETSSENPKRVVILLPSEKTTNANNHETKPDKTESDHAKKVVTIQGIPLAELAPFIRDKIPLSIFQTSYLSNSTPPIQGETLAHDHLGIMGKPEPQHTSTEDTYTPIDFGLIANVSHDLSIPVPIHTYDIAKESPVYQLINATDFEASVVHPFLHTNLSDASSTTIAPELICKEDEFKCINGNGIPGSCISILSRCDSIFDCDDHSDEAECVANKCLNNYQCRWSGDCLEKKFVCDGIKHCTDGDDEEGCDTWSCMSDEYRCDVGIYSTCIPLSYKCDGQPDCFNHTEEFNCSTECKKDHFLCQEGMCIPNSWKCDGKSDCSGGEDETDCDCEGLDQSPCAVGGCVPTFKLCDGLRQCPDGSDEWGCLRIENNTKQLQVRSSGGRWSAVCGDKWTSQWTDLVCEQIGFGMSLSTEVRRVNESVPRPRVKLSPDASEVSRRGRAPLQYLLTQGDCPTDPLVHVSCNMPQCGSWPVDTTDISILKHKTEVDLWPSMGLLIQPDKYKDNETVTYKYACAATIITPVWVIASYSCLESKINGFEAENWAFMIGKSAPKAVDTDTQLRHAKLMVPYPGAKKIGGFWVGDAVLLRLQRPLKFDDSIKPICLSDEPVASHEQCVIAAYKTNRKGGVDEGRNQFIQNLPVPNLTINTCNTSYYEGRLKGGHACASFLQDKYSTCKGNEGSPLMCKKKDGSWYLHGLLSHKGQCASFNLPSIFTDVGKINSWILRTIGRPTPLKGLHLTTTTTTIASSTTTTTTTTAKIDVNNDANAAVVSSTQHPIDNNDNSRQLNTHLNNGIAPPLIETPRNVDTS